MNPLFPQYRLLLCVAVMVVCFRLPVYSQTVVGGDTIDASAMLDVQSLDRGVLLPRLTTAQRNAMPNPARGLLIFNNDESCIQINAGSPQVPAWKCLGEGLPQTGNQPGSILYWNGTAWVRLSPGQPGQQLTLTPQGELVWTEPLPVVRTAAIGSVTYVFEGETPVFTAQVGGNVSSDGGGPLLGKGVVCSTDGNPSLSDHAHSVHGLGIATGAYSSTIPGLSPATTYTCKAYAFNSAGTAYGAAQTFTTPPRASITSLNCAGATTSTDLVAGKSPDDIVLTIPYTGGNGGVYASRDTTSTGLTGLTASLAAGTLSLGPGSLQYVLTGTTPAAGTANFSIRIGGQSCTVSRAVAPGAIAGLDCAGATFSGTVWIAGIETNTVMNLPYIGGNGGSHPGQTVASTGITGLTATLLPGNFATGSGVLTYTITGTPSGLGTANFALSIGGRVCTLGRNIVSLFSMKDIPAGTFSMGCTPGYPYCDSDEYPVHTVTLSAFQIGETEVTQAQWQTLMGSNPSSFSSCAQCPVENVSWYDAVVFCNRLSEMQGLVPCYFADDAFTQVYGKNGGSWSLPNSGEVYRNPWAKGYRLPTEAEWEYAARGGSATNIYSGSNNVDEVAWSSENSSDGTKPVKGKLANGYGLYDTSGNVWEWCGDWYGYYSSSAQINPEGPGTGSSRVYRGGSWRDGPHGCRVADRWEAPRNRENWFGFRLARSL